MQHSDIVEAIYRDADAAFARITMQHDARYIVRCNDDEINDAQRFHEDHTNIG
jgi:hypothetical protein